ncbi:hypothetical protein MMPV_010044 [Pyropia vietnamensis]
MDDTEETAATPYAEAIGPLPVLRDTTTHAPAWERETSRMGVADSAAHALFRGVDPISPGTIFAKQMDRLPHALVPSLADLSSSITVVRRRREVGYFRRFSSFSEAFHDPVPATPSALELVLPPPYLLPPDGEEPPAPYLTKARDARQGLTGYLVGWHQGEYSSCPLALRGQYYVKAPQWWPDYEVPYGVMAEPPLVLTYAREELRRGDPAAWSVFRAEWAVSTAVALLQAYDERRVVLLYPPRLRDWIRSVGATNIAADARGEPDDEVEGKLLALLRLLDELPHTSAFVERLTNRAPNRRDRAGWVSVVLEVGREGSRALVDEDLAPYELPYSSAVTEARLAVPNPWGAAVARRRHLVRFPGGGDVPPSSAYEPVPPVSALPEPRPPTLVPPRRGDNAERSQRVPRRIVAADALEHGDVPDHRFDVLHHLPPRGVALGLANFLGVDADELERYPAGYLVSALCHLVVDVSQGVLSWCRTVPEEGSTDLEGLLNLVGRRALRDAFNRSLPRVREGAEDRRRRWSEVGDGYPEGPPSRRARLEEYPSGWGR